MIKNKKIILGALSFATLTAPIASVIACGNCDNDNDNGGSYEDKTGFNLLLDQTRKMVEKRAKFVAQTNSSSLDINNPVFQYDADKSWTATDLGLVFPDNPEALPLGNAFAEGYYVEEVDVAAPSVKVRVFMVDIAGTVNFSSVSFFTITNFAVKYDLSKITQISPRTEDANIITNITNPAAATVDQIQATLTGVLQEYLSLQVAGVTAGATADYTAGTWTKADGTPIIQEDLTKAAVSYKVTVTANATNSKLQKQTTLTVTIPQLNWFDLSTLADFASAPADWQVTDKANVPTSYVLEVLNKEVLKKITDARPDLNVTWNDLYAIYTPSDGTTALPQKYNLTTAGQTIKLTLIALPDTDKVQKIANITIALPFFSDDDNEGQK